MQMKKIILPVAFICAFLVAATGCSLNADGDFSSGSKGDTDTRGTPGIIISTATLSGFVDLGPVSDIEVKAFFEDESGDMILIGKAVTSEGHYSIPIELKDNVIYLSASGGTYQESSSGEWIYISSNYELKQIVLWSNGVDQIAHINLYTTIATGKSEYLISAGQEITEALISAKSSIVAYVGSDPDVTTHLYPSDETSAGFDTTSLELMIGMRTTVTSDLIGGVNIFNGFPEHSIFTTIDYINLAYNDVRFDGYLDGFGYRGTSDVGELFLGKTKINEDFYRVLIARKTIDFIKSGRNKSDVNFTGYRNEANRISSFKGTLFKNVAQVSIDPEPPSVEWNVNTNEVMRGDKQFIISADDNTAVESVILSIGETVIHEWDIDKLSDEQLTWDSSSYEDGIHTISIDVTDILGNVTHLSETTFIQNVHYFPDVVPVITMSSEPFVGSSEYLFKGHYEDFGAGLDHVTVNGLNVDVDEIGNFSYLQNLVNGDNSFSVYAKTRFLRDVTTNFIVELDAIKPELSLRNLSGEYLVNYEGGSIEVDIRLAPLKKDTTDTTLAVKPEHISLNGLPLKETDLMNENRPFFSFTASDTNGQKDTSSLLKVYSTYKVGGSIIFTNKEMTSTDEDIYILPVSEEGLGIDYYKVLPDIIHEIIFVAVDRAGHEYQDTVKFRLKTVIEGMEISNIKSAEDSPLTTTEFINKTELFKTFNHLVSYTVTNTNNVDVWVKPEMLGTTYRIIRDVSEHIKTHKIDRTTQIRFYGADTLDTTQTVEIGNFFSFNSGSTVVNTGTGLGIWGGLSNNDESCRQHIKDKGLLYFENDLDGTTVSDWISTDTLLTDYTDGYEAIPGLVDTPDLVVDRITGLGTAVLANILLESGVHRETFFTPTFGIYCTASDSDWQYLSSRIPENVIATNFISSTGVAQKKIITEVSAPGYPRLEEVIASESYYGLTTRYSAVTDSVNIIESKAGWFKIIKGESIQVFLDLYVPTLNISDDPYDSTYTLRKTDVNYQFIADSKAIFRFVADNGDDNLGSLTEFLMNVDDGQFKLENSL